MSVSCTEPGPWQAAVAHALDGLAQASDRVLEVGSGTGAHTLGLARRCRAVVAVDASAEMVAYLERRLGREGISNVDTRPGRLPDDLPAGGGYDGVLAVGVLNYPPDLAAALRALARTLRPGGWAVVTVPRNSPGGWLYRAWRSGPGSGCRLPVVHDDRVRGAGRGEDADPVAG